MSSSRSERAPKRNVLTLTDPDGNILGSITMPYGQYVVEVVERDWTPKPFVGPAVVIREKRVL